MLQPKRNRNTRQDSQSGTRTSEFIYLSRTYSLRELFQGQSIQDILRPQPGSARHRDAVPHIQKVLRLMRVGRDRESRPARLSLPQHVGAEIEPLRAGVDLQTDASADSRVDHALAIAFERL